MCENPVPCACTLETRARLREQHMARADAFSKLAYRLRGEGHITEDEAYLLYRQSESEWDDAIHIASPDNPMLSLCGNLGRNLVDLPERPDSWGGCWTCLMRADEIAPVAKELATA